MSPLPDPSSAERHSDEHAALERIPPALFLPQREPRSLIRHPSHFLHMSRAQNPPSVANDLPVTPPLVSRIALVQTQPLPVPSMLEGIPFDQQPTWIIPAQASVQGRRKSQPVVPTSGRATVRRQRLNDVWMYALTAAFAPLVALGISPFLVSALAPEQYGLLVVLNTTLALLAGITQLGLGNTFSRVYGHEVGSSHRYRLSVLSTTVILLLAISLPCVVFLIALAPWLAAVILHNSSPYLIIWMALTLLLQNLTVPTFSWLRAERKVLTLCALMLTSVLVNLGMTLLLVGVYHLGLSGALLAVGCGYLVVVLFTLPEIWRRAGFQYRRTIAWQLLMGGLAGLPGLVSICILQLMDRYLLAFFDSFALVGSYAVGSLLGNILTPLIIMPFSLAWYAAISSIAQKEQATMIFQLIFRWYSMVLLLAVLTLSMLGPLLLDVFYPSFYHASVLVISSIALSNLFYGLFEIFMVGMIIRHRLWFNTILIIVAALVNLACNLLLIPLYGPAGAAISTLCAYGVMALLAYLINQSLYPLPFEIGRFAFALLVGGVCFAGNLLLTGLPEPLAWSLAFLLLALYASFLIVWGEFPVGALLRSLVARRRMVSP